MHPHAPHPELFTRIAALLAALRGVIFCAVPQLFYGISKDTRAQIAAATAMLRRYLHILAAELALPPLGLLEGEASSPAQSSETTRQRTALLRLTEDLYPSASSHGGEGSDPPELQWALMIARLRQLIQVMDDPTRHAKRLAQTLRLRQMICLKPMPLRWHQIRRLPPEMDALLIRLDQVARPDAWALLNSS